MAARKQTAIVGLKVRLREPLRKKLEVAAKKKGVSLNAELVARLEESFLGEGLLDRMEKILAAFDNRIARLDDLVALASWREDDLTTAIRRSEREI
ncbi:MAG: Arc family DNA-binding protein [Methyloceanibacter sp.]|uniref:Arc family DNA-binding protein n=1 Tax=Methyloceanibacter sp. TaxID=1965321 RepID=UPI003D9AFB4D